MIYTLDISSRTAFELIMAIDKRVSDNLYKMGREESPSPAETEFNKHKK